MRLSNWAAPTGHLQSLSSAPPTPPMAGSYGILMNLAQIGPLHPGPVTGIAGHSCRRRHLVGPGARVFGNADQLLATTATRIRATRHRGARRA